MPAFLAQLAAPGAQFVRATGGDGSPLRYLFDPEKESFAEFVADGESWTVRQGGPVGLWDDVERSIVTWQAMRRPGDRLRTAPGDARIPPVLDRPGAFPALGAPDHLTRSPPDMHDEPLSPRASHLNLDVPRAIQR